MARYGYNIVLLRDATTGVEFPDTCDDLLTTDGFSASNVDFLQSVERVDMKCGP